MEIIEFKDYLYNLPRYLENKNSSVLVTADKLYVLNGENDYNKEYCNLNGLTVLNTHKFGGTIVNAEGDLCIGNYQHIHNDFGKEFLGSLIIWLNQRGLRATFDNNDVLIDNKYKVASYMSTWVNNCLYTAIHISINVDLELIQNICTKTMNKIPKGLSDFGITTDEVEKFIISIMEGQ